MNISNYKIHQIEVKKSYCIAYLKLKEFVAGTKQLELSFRVTGMCVILIGNRSIEKIR